MNSGITRAIAVFSLAVAVSGCTQGDCKDGTYRKGDTCYPYDPFDHTPPTITVSPPVRTRSVGTVTLTSNKPATIYYTTDGSTPTTSSSSHADEVVIPDQPDNAVVSFFAVDLAANTSAVQTVSWEIDRTGPGVVQGVQLALSGTTRTVTWAAPTDPHFGGVIVARVDGALDSSPLAGTTYQVGDKIGTSITVVATAPATATGMQTFTESATASPGLVRYVAWAFDDLENYGPATAAYQLVALPAQTPTVTATAATGVVAVTTPALNLDVSGSATLAGTTLSVNLAIKNNTNRPLFAPKALLTTAPTGVTWSNSDGTFAGSPYRAYGGAILPGATATATWTFTGATSSTVLALPLDVRDNKIIVASQQGRGANAGSMIDASAGKCSVTTTAGCTVSSDCPNVNDVCTMASIHSLGHGPAGPSGGTFTRGGGVTPDGYVLLGQKNSGALAAFDLQTGRVVQQSVLLPQKAGMPQVVLDAAGASGYAIVGFGHRLRQGGTQSFVVRFDTGSLVETGRIDIGVSASRALQISPDGNTLAIATGLAAGGVIEIDLETFQIVRRLGVGTAARGVAFTPDSATIIATALDGIHRYDRASGTEGALVQVTGGSFETGLASDGKLWIGRAGAVLAVDLAAGTAQSLAFPATSLTMFDGEAYVGSSCSSQIAHVDNTGTRKRTLTFVGSMCGHRLLQRSPF